jgi:hypothetical protein
MLEKIKEELADKYLIEKFGSKTGNKDVKDAFLKGIDMDKKIICEFFMFFRDNGEKYIGITIEKLTDIFIQKKLNKEI